MHQTGWTALIAVLLHPRDSLMQQTTAAMTADDHETPTGATR